MMLNDKDGKISGLKTHNFHVLHRLLPIGTRAYLSENVSTAIVELCAFFSDLCAKTIPITDLDRLQADIIVILCKLEKIFSSAFFDVMVQNFGFIVVASLCCLNFSKSIRDSKLV